MPVALLCVLHVFPAVWWAVSTFYQLGAGHDLAPVTLPEVVFTMVYIAINILLWAWLIGSVTLLVTRGDDNGAKYRNRMHALERYGKDRGLPQVWCSAPCMTIWLHRIHCHRQHISGISADKH